VVNKFEQVQRELETHQQIVDAHRLKLADVDEEINYKADRTEVSHFYPNNSSLPRLRR